MIVGLSGNSGSLVKLGVPILQPRFGRLRTGVVWEFLRRCSVDSPLCRRHVGPRPVDPGGRPDPAVVGEWGWLATDRASESARWLLSDGLPDGRPSRSSRMQVSLPKAALAHLATDRFPRDLRRRESTVAACASTAGDRGRGVCSWD